MLCVRLALCGAIMSVASLDAVAASESAADRLRDSLGQLQQWLGEGANADRWRRFLRTEQLETELRGAANADRRALSAILGAYRSGVPGLSAAPFQRVQETLRDWSNELAVPMALRWAGAARAAAQAPLPTGQSEVRDARSHLEQASRSLDRFLSGAPPDQEARWKSYLAWQQLEDYLREGGDEPNRQLQTTFVQLFSGHPGLELPPFVAVRRALQRYLYLRALQGNPQASRQISGQLESLASALEAYNDQPSALAVHEIARQVDWLRRLGQVPALAAEIRGAYRRPNLHVRVSEALVSRAVTDAVNERTPVDEMILGTRVRGTGDTVGRVSANLLPGSDRSHIELVLTGTTFANTIGTQGPVRIYSRSTTSIAARKRLTLTGGESAGPALRGSDPAQVSCQTSSQILDIVPRPGLGARLVERVAWRRAGEQLPLVQQIAARRAERRVAQMMERRVQATLQQFGQRLADDLERPLRRRGLLPESLGFRSTDQELLIDARLCNPAQLAAVQSPPAFSGADLIVQLHESFVNNVAEQGLAGLTLTDARVAELVRELTGSVPEELELSEDKSPWSMSFDWSQPFTATFRDRQLTLAVRGRQFTSGENTLIKTMQIAARYDMSVADSGIQLVRDGDIEVTFPGRSSRRLNSSDLFFKTLMQKKFAGLFRPRIVGEGIALTGRWSRLGTLRLVRFLSREGWLSLGWR
jgi:hypothetical protein